MSTTSKGRHAAAWSFEKAIADAQQRGVPGTGKRRANLIHVFRNHLTRRFGK